MSSLPPVMQQRLSRGYISVTSCTKLEHSNPTCNERIRTTKKHLEKTQTIKSQHPKWQNKRKWRITSDHLTLPQRKTKTDTSHSAKTRKYKTKINNVKKRGLRSSCKRYKLGIQREAERCMCLNNNVGSWDAFTC